jgi:hypothetical protein
MDIPFPPNPKIILPIRPMFQVSEAPDFTAKSVMRVREFELQNYGGGPEGYADYLEAAVQ